MRALQIAISISSLALSLALGLSAHAAPASVCENSMMPIYALSRDHVAPAVTGAVDQTLRHAAQHANSHIVFVARDGIGGFQIAQQLLQRFPDRYPGLSLQSVHYLYLNKHTIRSPRVTEYVRQAGIETGSTVTVFDLGWYGTLTQTYADLFERQLGGQFGGLSLVLSPRSNSLSRAYIDLGAHPGPFAQIPGNPAVHFLEDTFSGTAGRPSELLQNSDGTITPRFPETPYPEANHRTREQALRALSDYAAEITLKELQSLTPSNTRRRLYELMNQPEVFRPLGVPHERH